MRRIEKILLNIVGAVIAIYAAIVLLFSLPFMQSALANWTADALSDQLHAKVEIGSINLGFLNRVIVNDMTIYEPSGKQMAKVARMSASLNLFSLLSGNVDIGTAQLFGTKATLYKKTPDSPPNYQFIVDAFSSEEEKPTKLNLHVGSLIMRHVDITYDILSEERHPGHLDVNHLNLKDVGMNLMLRCLTDDTLNISVRRLQAKDLNSGLQLLDTRAKLVGNKQKALLSDFSLSLPHSIISTDSLRVEYGHFEADSTFKFSGTPILGHITPSDLTALYSDLSNLTRSIPFTFSAEGDEKVIRINECNIGDLDGDFLLRATATATGLFSKQKRNIQANINTLYVSHHEMLYWANVLFPEHHQEKIINAIQYVDYEGSINYAANGDITSQGNILTGIGDTSYDLTYGAEHFLTANISGKNVNVGALQEDSPLGTASFDLEVAMNLTETTPFPAGALRGDIHNIYYKDYNYQDIKVDVRSTTTAIEGTLSLNDNNAKGTADFAYTDSPSKGMELNLLLEEFRLNRLNLTNQYNIENVDMNVTANLKGADYNHLYGALDIADFNLYAPTEHYHLEGIRITAERQGENQSLYTINSDFLSGNIEGEASLLGVAQSFSNQIAHHLPILVSPTQAEPARFDYDLTLSDTPLLHYFTNVDFALSHPIHIYGAMDTRVQEMSFQLNAPQIEYNNTPYEHIVVKCNSTTDNMNLRAMASTYQESDDDEKPSTQTKLELNADVHNNYIGSNLHLSISGHNNIDLQLMPMVHLHDSLGSMKTDITLHPSQAVINDTTWTVSPATISLYKKDIECHNVKFAKMGTNSFLAIDGKASPSPSDSLVATLSNLEIKYLQSLANFNVVRFAGKASGRAVVNNVMGGGVPDIRTNLYVEDMSLQEGPLGDANITAHWDKEVEGIVVEGRIIDQYDVPDALTGQKKNVTGITTVDGWISPAKNDISLLVNTQNTNATFLHGFLRGIFKEISGYITGPVRIIGPFNNVNILADAVPNMNLRLRATNVPYHIEGDTIRMRPYLFDFQNISIYDRFGHRSTLNGQVTHRNMKNFAYHFKADLHELLAYDEKEFNSDKFLATVFADGNLTIDGSDGHPLYVNASVTPTKGSVFAYDAATPDAITGNSFIEFRDRDSITAFNPRFFNRSPEEEEKPVVKDSLTIVKEAKKNYNSDIFINFDINLTPACEVKLRMDNLADDGYMHTFGNAKIKAQWYNKGSFQMFGNYNIESGAYRLYLQDIIFRDLALQPGSMVEFNGNPFDANIHLLCHHTINSVPLSDLTNTTAFSQNNKVKVICLLDITGKLGNMDFKFDIDLPNVNEEVRQLVRSMINSEEEMNTQAIYLLGVGRFYPNEYARANGNGNSGQAANSLLSSTLSGQINQMLSNMMGNNPNWNFGSSLTTGEKGWQDLDVEGILEGRLLDERLIINGAFGYRDNAMTNNSGFIGDFEVKWRMDQKGNLYVKAYNQTNDRYFTKSTLNTQGIGLSWRRQFESIRRKVKEREKTTRKKHTK